MRGDVSHLARGGGRAGAVAARVFLKAAKSSRAQRGRRDRLGCCVVAIGSAVCLPRPPSIGIREFGCARATAKRRVVSFPGSIERVTEETREIRETSRLLPPDPPRLYSSSWATSSVPHGQLGKASKLAKGTRSHVRYAPRGALP